MSLSDEYATVITRQAVTRPETIDGHFIARQHVQYACVRSLTTDRAAEITLQRSTSEARG